MHYLHTLYIDGASVAEIEIRVDPYLTRTDELALELSVTDVDGQDHEIRCPELLSIILAKYRDDLWRIALERDQDYPITCTKVTPNRSFHFTLLKNN
jgi:hypothetical protein